MLTTMDALIGQGAGGRKLMMLRQVWDLFVKIGGTVDEAPVSLFDEIMANIAAELDDDCVLLLAEDFGHSQAMLSAFKSTVASRAHEVKARREAAETLAFTERTEANAPLSAIATDQQFHPEAAVADQDAGNVVTLMDVANPRPTEPPMVPSAEPSAQRLTEAMTNALVARGDRAAILTALADQTAPFTRSSLTTLVELAVSDRALKEALVARRDLPEAMVERLMPFLKPSARASILMSGASFTAEDAEDALEQAQRELIEAYRTGQRMLGVDSCIALVEEEKATNDEIVVLLGRDLRIVELASFVARRLGLRLDTALNALGGRLDHSAAVLLKVLGAGNTATATVMDMRRRLGCRTARETASAVATQGRYSETEARELLRCMDGVGRTAPKAVAEPEFVAA
jgi:hypothetical protein